MSERRPQRHSLLVIGQSHVAAIRDAAKAHREAHPDEPRTRVIHTREPAYAPELEGARLGPALSAAIADQIARHRPIVASVIGGNAHNVLALARHARPFDFLLDGEGPPIDAGAELIPLALVRAALAEALAPDLARISALAAEVEHFIQLESPPPVADEAYIAAQAEAWFRARGGGTVVPAGRGVRWRMWRLANRIVASHVAQLGRDFGTVPKAVLTDDGFLAVGFAADPTHGNAAYGAAVIAMLDARAG